MLSKLRDEHASDLSLADFKALVRDQFLMLELDEAQAVATIRCCCKAMAITPRRLGAARERGDGAGAAGQPLRRSAFARSARCSRPLQLRRQATLVRLRRRDAG